jgi:hypothetical protein
MPMSERYLKRVVKVVEARYGVVNDIARVLKIDPSTVYMYRNTYPAIKEAFERARSKFHDIADDAILATLEATQKSALVAEMAKFVKTHTPCFDDPTRKWTPGVKVEHSGEIKNGDSDSIEAVKSRIAEIDRRLAETTGAGITKA